MKVLRCAVYTRKSTDDGLDQQFNSLDAQREACEAYITSQRHEGWELAPGSFDDGGYSGGTMDRPGLKALLAEVDAGRIDVIVVYKVDRLTRSLADFAKIVERLDARGASFVSVTQAFNTTTSMGRLTLNVLLSFAQFEREVTSERIRDKIAASKKKGLWMGGPVPLGYQVIERKLVPVPEEADRVRMIMRRYLELKSVPALIEALRDEGIVTKVQRRTSGPHRGGIPFERGSLFHLLKNPVYVGKIVHKGILYDGEHDPIIDVSLWDAVQAQLKDIAPARRRPQNDRSQALLEGLITDPAGRPVVPTYTTKGSRRYSYYETRKDLAGCGGPPAVRFRQGLIDDHVSHGLAAFLRDEAGLLALSEADEAARLRSTFDRARQLADQLDFQITRRQAARSAIVAVRLGDSMLELKIDPTALGAPANGVWNHTMPLPTRRPFAEVKLRIERTGRTNNPNSDLAQLFAEAAEVRQLVLASPDLSLNQLGRREGRCRTHLGRLLRIAWLSPRIADAIACGEVAPSFSRKELLETEFPLSWVGQENVLGVSRKQKRQRAGAGESVRRY